MTLSMNLTLRNKAHIGFETMKQVVEVESLGAVQKGPVRVRLLVEVYSTCRYI